MKTWQKVMFPFVVVIAIGGSYLYSVWRHRQDPGVIGRMQAANERTLDDVAVTKLLSAMHFEDTLALQGTSVWMKNGYSVAYFPYSGGRIEFTKRVGTVPALARLDIKKIIKSATPAAVDDGMSHGTRQSFAIFAMAGKDGLFATPLGEIDGNQEFYFCDTLYFYDDPHTIYNYWPKDVWAAIDAHQVKPGMNELQTQLAVGENMDSASDQKGDRTVTYDQDGKRWAVTFVNNKATTIKN